MKRFTQYLYEYQKDRRVRNIGFVKAEQREASCILQIQGKGLSVKDDEELKVYLFYKRDENYEAVYQGGISRKRPMINFTLEFSAEDIGNAESLEDVLGIMLLEPGGKRYVAVWSGNSVNVEEISTEMRKEETPPLAEVPEVQEPIVREEEVLQIQVEEERVCEKIQRKDLARLPRRDWKLANNNFLLHGFYNYHHLLWIEENGELYIGVPGVNHAREMQAAQAFGFTQFWHLADVDLELSDDETNPGEDFGYFCRRIKRNE